MKFTVKLLPIVHTDLKLTKKWYNDQKINLGEEFKKEVNKEIDHISKFPLNYQIKYKSLRQSLVRKFPYSIFYFVKEEKKQIVIVGIIHNSRNPEIVRRRQ